MAKPGTCQLKAARVIPRTAFTLILVAFLPLFVRCQEVGDSASLHGIIRNSQGESIAGVMVSLRAKDSTQTFNTRTDKRGSYSFAGLRSGVYILQAEMTEYGKATIADVYLGPRETKSADLALAPAKSSAPQPTLSAAPQFFDKPQFTVSGVTDTTNIGGHGSDAIMRTQESLAKQAVSLGNPPAGSPPTASAEREKSLRERAQREPLSFDANQQLGKLLVEDGKAGEAISYLERAVELNSNNYETAYDLALANADAGNYDRARDQARALMTHNDKAELHHMLGNVEEKLGDSLDAVREYQHAAELDPSEPYLFDWGSELLLHHAPEPALEVFGKGNQLFPRSVRMLIGVGAAWFASGSYDQAVQRICEASDLEPGNSIPYLFLGKMQSAETVPSDELVEKLHRFLTLQPENAEANYYYAVGLWKSREVTQDEPIAPIESLLKKAIDLDPKFAAAYLQLGILHSEQRNYPGAISEYQHALRIAPQIEEAHYRLAQAYRHIGEMDKAKAEVQLYAEITKESAQQAERERHEIQQFVYTLRAPPRPQEQH